MGDSQIGAMIDGGIHDWQIFQRDADGFGRIDLHGRWAPDASGVPGVVEVRLVAQDTGAAVSRDTDWQTADTRADGTWRIALQRIPAGGLYRLETHLRPEGAIAGEWAVRGDMRHCIGVGDLWVIAGQSNSAGYGRGPYHDPAELGVHLYRNAGQWALATHPMNDSTDTLHSVNRENANPSHSPYLHFGRLLKSALGYPVGLIQTALGGSPLSRWNPAEHAEAANADLCANMLHCVRQAGGRVAGVLWYQGESDSNETLAASYEARFSAAVAAWRAALSAPDLPVLMVQLNRVYQQPVQAPGDADRTDRAWSMVREAQRQAARALANVAVVPALDLPLSDLIHTSAAGNLLLADRLARAAFGMVYGKAVDYKAPDALSAARSPDQRAITIVFDNVTSRIDSVDLTTHCFTVEDASGAVPIASVGYPGDHTVQLALGRALAGAAMVHGACGVNPPIAPVDMDRVMPMLGFYGLAVSP
jgi:sialate O-acetylesterase